MSEATTPTPEELEQLRLSIQSRELDHRIEYENRMLDIEMRKIALEEFKYGINRPSSNPYSAGQY